jgi:hypothetical protein
LTRNNARVPRLRLRTTALLGTAAAALALTGGPGAATATTTHCLLPGTGKPLDRLWRPHMLAAIGYTDTRTGDVAFAVRTDHRFYGYRPDHDEWSASVVKAMLMVAYLNQPGVTNRALNAHDRGLLTPMITESETEVTAADQTRFFLHIDSFIPGRHRAYAMSLLAGIVPSQRWGIGEVAPKGWKLYFKGGWGYGTGLLDHQVVLLARGCARVSIAVLTMHDGSHAYGKDTLKGIFARLLRGLPTKKAKKHRGARIRTGDLKHPKLAR